MRIVLVTPGYAAGGTGTIALNLFKGLRQEGYSVEFLKLRAKNILRLYEEAKIICKLKKCDVVIFIGANFWWNQVFIRSKKALFVHGFVIDEFLQSLKQFSFGGIAGRLPLIAYWKVLGYSGIWNFFIFQSETSWERNGMPKDYVILPQFILLDDIKSYSSLQTSDTSSDLIRIMTYTSFIKTPRLLSTEELLALARKIGGLSDKRIEFNIVSPIDRKYPLPESIESENLKIKMLPSMPRVEFLKLLASSDLYIERCLDEELGNASIEAGLIGVPIAKITHHKYFERQDYCDKEIILAKSMSELCTKVSEYLRDIKSSKKAYAARMREFLATKGSWNMVKSALLEKLN